MEGLGALSALCPTDEVIPSEYLNGRRYYEFMVSLNQKYSNFPARKAFKLTYPLICRRLRKLHRNFLLFPEISEKGLFHYHICIEYIPANSVFYYDFKTWAKSAIGHTDGYTIETGIHKETKPTDVAECRCLLCRLTYMYKQQALMKTVLRSKCPLDVSYFEVREKIVKDLKDEMVKKANQRNLGKVLKYYEYAGYKYTD